MDNQTFAPPPQKNKSKARRIILVIIINILVLGAVATAVVFVFLRVKGAPAVSQTVSQQILAPKTGMRAGVDETKTFEKGQTALFGYFEVTVNKATPNYQSKDSLPPQNSGYTFLVLNITAKNTDKAAHLLSDIDLAVLSGADIINSTYVVNVDPVLKSGAVQPGASVTGNLVYEVPPDAKNLDLYYNTQIYNNQKAKLSKIEYILPF